MWRSVATRSKQVARNLGATQNPKVPSSKTLTLAQSQSQFSTWVFTTKPSIYNHQSPRFLSQLSPNPIDETSVSHETDHSSLGFGHNGDDAQMDHFAPGNERNDILGRPSLGFGESSDDTQIENSINFESFAPGNVGFGENSDTQVGIFAPESVGFGGDGDNTQMDIFAPGSVGFGGDGDNAQIDSFASGSEEGEEEEVYKIDTNKLESVLSLLQSRVDGSLESSLDSMGLDLHEEFLVKVLETPLVLGENLIGFFKWVMKKPEFNVTTRVVDVLVRAICSEVRKRDAYALWDLVQEIGEKENVVLNVEILNELITLFSKLGKGKAALEVFNKCGDFGCAPNAETYYFTIEALCRRSFFDWAWSVCEKMVDAGSLPDSEKVGKIIALFCKGHKAKDIHLVYMLAKEKEKYPPRSSVNFLISSLCQKDETVKLALEMLDDFSGEARKYAIKPFSAVVRGLCRMKDVDGAGNLVSKMIVEGPPPGNAVFNSVINGYSKAGDMEKAMEMIKLMKSRGLKPDVYTYTVVMSGYANGGQMEEACKVLSEAKKKHSKLSPVTYHTLIRGYCKLEEFDKALKLLAEMKEFGVQTNVDEYNKLIQSLCLKALDWESAEKLLEEMKENGLHLNGVTRALIKAVKELEEEGLGNAEENIEA